MGTTRLPRARHGPRPPGAVGAGRCAAL